MVRAYMVRLECSIRFVLTWLDYSIALGFVLTWLD